MSIAQTFTGHFFLKSGKFSCIFRYSKNPRGFILWGLKGNFIENDDLYRYYANADIVLNDHRDDMRYYGFVSNRVYDVTASGGFVLTDYLPEIEEAYGDSVATYKDYYDFKEKLEYYLAHPEVRAEMAQRARQITLERFTADKAAQIFDGIFKNIKK